MASVEDLREQEAAAATSNGHEPDLEGEGDDEAAEIHDEVMIAGDGQLTLAIGGKTPTDSKVVIRGGAIALEGQFKKGESVALILELRCAEVHVIDKIDTSTREVTGTTRKHVLKVEGVRRVGQDLPPEQE